MRTDRTDVTSLERINQVLKDNGYRRLKEIGLDRGEYVTWWGGPLAAIVHEYGGNDGFDVYFIHPSQSVDETINAITQGAQGK